MISKEYGSPVSILRGVDKRSLATQGKSRQILTNFSYLHGARFWESLFTNTAMETPTDIAAWEPHPDYMKLSHPLRAALDTNVLVLLSPSKDLFFQQMGATDQTQSFFESYVESLGGYFNVILGMMVHEIYHVKESDDKANGRAFERKVDEDRKTLINNLTSDSQLKDLYLTYAKIVFSLGDQLKQPLSENEANLLQDLTVVIRELKSKYPNAWNYIWSYEYTEGFAEYVSAFSMIQVGVTSLDAQIDLQKADHNNLAYRTGAIGGLYLALRLKKMPFDKNQDHTQSLWEIILSLTNHSQANTDIAKVIEKYAPYPMNGDLEIQQVIEYLTSTVMEE